VVVKETCTLSLLKVSYFEANIFIFYMYSLKWDKDFAYIKKTKPKKSGII